jgi:hypothetical protein
MKNGVRETLDERLAKLPRDIVPPRYLWPSIVREIARRPRSTPQMAFAAAAAVAALCLATGLVWAILHARPTPTSAPAAANVALSFDEPQNVGYVAARAALQQTFRERLALLDPDTRAKIEASLAVIHQARDDIRKALAADPESPVLQQLLESAWRDEFDLYDNVVRTTQPTLARI